MIIFLKAWNGNYPGDKKELDLLEEANLVQYGLAEFINIDVKPKPKSTKEGK
jgi:hypothetical protein